LTAQTRSNINIGGHPRDDRGQMTDPLAINVADIRKVIGQVAYLWRISRANPMQAGPQRLFVDPSQPTRSVESGPLTWASGPDQRVRPDGAHAHCPSTAYRLTTPTLPSLAPRP
jgi:hypothetical protein